MNKIVMTNLDLYSVQLLATLRILILSADMSRMVSWFFFVVRIVL